jgi:hypothetical protein
MSNLILHDNASNEDLSYYLMLRKTIHGLDNIIVTVITQSLPIITGILALSVLLYEKIDNKFSATILALFLIIISFFTTKNSKRRVKLYSDLLGQTVATAQEIEKKIIREVNERLTDRLQNNVEHAGIKGEKLYLNSINVFYVIEAGLFIYFLVRACICLC